MDKVSLASKFAAFSEHWSPKIVGELNGQHVKIVRALGFDAALSTAWGVATAATDRYQLPRFTPWDRSPVAFVMRLGRNLFHPIHSALA